ncbi:MAG: hypothetical protein ACLQHT_12905 [Terracidiphilus sp.]
MAELATATQIPDRRWRQGCIVPHEAVPTQLQLTLGGEALLILLAQDCDILHDDYLAEPSVELHIARPAAERDGNLLHAKNPRRLQFAVRGELYEIGIHEKCTVPRTCLLDHAPLDLVLDEIEIRTIIRWTANRYMRSAFPDEFNRRLFSAKQPLKKIVAALKRDGELVTNIFLRVDPMDEIGDGEKYRVILRFTALEEVLGQTEAAKRAIELTEFIQREFAAVGGVEIEDCKLVSEDDFSLADLRETMRWDYDYLSFRGGAPNDPAPNTA